MRTFLLSISLALCLGACKSPSDKGSFADVPCTCGTPEAAIDGCSNSRCISGEGTPDNPDCVCSPIDLED
jgi:hypothetical protein